MKKYLLLFCSIITTSYVLLLLYRVIFRNPTSLGFFLKFMLCFFCLMKLIELKKDFFGSNHGFFSKLLLNKIENVWLFYEIHFVRNFLNSFTLINTLFYRIFLSGQFVNKKNSKFLNEDLEKKQNKFVFFIIPTSSVILVLFYEIFTNGNLHWTLHFFSLALILRKIFFSWLFITEAKLVQLANYELKMVFPKMSYEFLIFYKKSFVVIENILLIDETESFKKLKKFFWHANLRFHFFNATSLFVHGLRFLIYKPLELLLRDILMSILAMVLIFQKIDVINELLVVFLISFFTWITFLSFLKFLFKDIINEEYYSLKNLILYRRCWFRSFRKKLIKKTKYLNKVDLATNFFEKRPANILNKIEFGKIADENHPVFDENEQKFLENLQQQLTEGFIKYKKEKDQEAEEQISNSDNNTVVNLENTKKTIIVKTLKICLIILIIVLIITGIIVGLWYLWWTQFQEINNLLIFADDSENSQEISGTNKF